MSNITICAIMKTNFFLNTGLNHLRKEELENFVNSIVKNDLFYLTDSIIDMNENILESLLNFS